MSQVTTPPTLRANCRSTCKHGLGPASRGRAPCRAQHCQPAHSRACSHIQAAGARQGKEAQGTHPRTATGCTGGRTAASCSPASARRKRLRYLPKPRDREQDTSQGHPPVGAECWGLPRPAEPAPAVPATKVPMPFTKAWDWHAAYCRSACGDTVRAPARPPRPVPGSRPPGPAREGRRLPGAWRPRSRPDAAAPGSPWRRRRRRPCGARGPGPGARGPPLPRRRHGGAAGAFLRPGGRAGPVPLLLLPRGRPRLCRHRLAPQGGTCLPEDGVAKLRESLRRGAVSLSLQDGRATLQLQGEAGHSALHLCKLPVAEARTQLQALMFGLATSIKKLEEQLEVVGTLGSSCSPEKNAAQSQQLFLPEPSPRKNRAAGSALSAKRKIPGESLINPGFKSKKAPSGVDFEDS
uniref:PAXX non-homologous end joining factor n=1 Tax=Cairina moschata TaxID=8855 RepID=A0A8C3CHF5_CAIMO